MCTVYVPVVVTERNAVLVSHYPHSPELVYPENSGIFCYKSMEVTETPLHLGSISVRHTSAF